MLFVQQKSKFVEPTSYRNLTLSEKDEVDNFIDKIIADCWIESTTFKVKDVVGRKVFANWKNTPLQRIWDYNHASCDDPDRQSGIDVGHIFKLRLAKSKYPFNLQKDYFNTYIPIKTPYEIA